MKRFVERGKKRLETKFDLIHIIKYHSKHHDHLIKNDENLFQDDSLNLDSDSQEDEPTATTNFEK